MKKVKKPLYKQMVNLMQILTVTSGKAGMKGQVDSVALALLNNSYNAKYNIKTLHWDWQDTVIKNYMYYWLFFIWDSSRNISEYLSKIMLKIPVFWLVSTKMSKSDSFVPDIILSCGRRGAIASRLLKKTNFPKAKLVHIEDPRTGYDDFDLIFLPKHDNKIPVVLKNAKVVITTGAFSPFVKSLPKKPNHPAITRMAKPRRCVLIGGSGKGLKMTLTWVDRFIEEMDYKQTKHGGEWAITFSRRTSNKIKTRFINKIRTTQNLAPKVWIWPGLGNNPYSTMLSNADEIIVSIDSTSMLLQAVATKADLFLLDMPGSRSKITRLTDRIVSSGRGVWFCRSKENIIQATIAPKLNKEDKKDDVWNSIPLACYEIYRILKLN